MLSVCSVVGAFPAQHYEAWAGLYQVSKRFVFESPVGELKGVPRLFRFIWTIKVLESSSLPTSWSPALWSGISGYPALTLCWLSSPFSLSLRTLGFPVPWINCPWACLYLLKSHLSTLHLDRSSQLAFWYISFHTFFSFLHPHTAIQKFLMIFGCGGDGIIYKNAILVFLTWSFSCSKISLASFRFNKRGICLIIVDAYIESIVWLCHIYFNQSPIDGYLVFSNLPL